MGNGATCIQSSGESHSKSTFAFPKTLLEAHLHFSINPELVSLFIDFVRDSNNWMAPILQAAAGSSSPYLLPQGSHLDIERSNSLYGKKSVSMTSLKTEGLMSKGDHIDDIDILMMALAMPRFLERHCRDMSTTLPLKMILPKTLSNRSPSESSLPITEALSRCSSHTLENSTLDSMIIKIAQTLHVNMAEDILNKGSIISSLFTYLDNFKLPISVSSATGKGSKGERFPLVFVNKAFETLTGYNRTEILGSNCSFLQCQHHTEKQQIAQLRRALDEQLPVKVGMTNVRKNGSRFFNLLAIAPIANPEGEVQYMMGMQYELAGHEEEYPDDLQVIEQLLQLFPCIWH